VAGYNLYRSTVSGSGYVKINSTLITKMSAIDATVQNGKTYFYVATAVDANGNESPFSNEASAVIPQN
jgi:fibronectin type 3 domain-containing protein